MERIKSNGWHINNCLYLADNQNGFKNCLKHHYKDFSYSWQDIKYMLQNYPKHYPVLFNIIDQTFECGRIYIGTFPPHTFNKLLKQEIYSKL